MLPNIDALYVKTAGVFALSLCLIGCGKEGPVTYRVTGTVTFDDQPVEEGEIIFRAADGASGSWETRIVGGNYRLETTPGAKKIEITARRKIEGGPVAESGEPAINFEAYIPEIYNEKSELTERVSPDGSNKFDFHLKGKALP